MDERELAALASTQLGLLTLDQARGAGLTYETVKWRVRTGRLEPIHRGVYRVGGSPRSTNQDLLAACLAIGPDAAVSHRSAAALWGLLRPEPGLIEVTTTRRQAPKLTGVTVHRLADLTPRWVTTLAGIPCTDPRRTLADLPAVVGSGLAGLALDRACGRRLVTTSSVRLAVDAVARQGRRRVRVARRLLDERTDLPRPAGVLEARLATLLRRHGVPMPIAEYEVYEDGCFLGRVDFAYPEIKLAVEVDGYEHHSSVAAFCNDRARQNDLVAAGWAVLRYTWWDVNSRKASVAGGIARKRTQLIAHFGRLTGA